MPEAPDIHTPADAQANASLRTLVLIDYQNMYRSARDAFDWNSEAGVFGNFRPYGLGRQMVRDASRCLAQVRVYTGIHTPLKNSVQNAVMQRRISAWVAESPDTVQVFPSALKYHARRPAQEKGVDVELAVDLVQAAMDDAFDVVVIASADTDLVPALRLVGRRFPAKTLVTLGYAPLPGREGRAPQPLDLADHEVERRFVTKRDFDRIADKTNYYESASDASNALPAGRWARITRRTG